MIRLAFYFGIGALLHLAFVGSYFDFNSAWTWLWLFAWPFMMIFSLFAFLLAGGIVFMIVIVSMIVFAAIAEVATGSFSKAAAKLRRSLKRAPLR